MFRKLNMELARLGWTKKVLSEKAEIPYSTLLDKLSGRTPLTLDDCSTIKAVTRSTLAIEELFEH